MAKVIKQEYIYPQANKQTYFTTPAKDNTTNYSGVIGEIGTNDFMIEFVGNFENTTNSNRIIALSNTTACFNITTEFGKNMFYWLIFPAGSGSEDNNIRIQKQLSNNKLFHIVIGRSGTSAWACVNGVFYRKTQSEVLTISNQLTISNAKKFALFRKFNFADEDYAKKLYNGGRWWDVSVEREMMDGDSSADYLIMRIQPGDGGPDLVVTSNIFNNKKSVSITCNGLSTNNGRPFIQEISPYRKPSTRYMYVIDVIINSGKCIVNRLATGNGTKSVTIEQELISGINTLHFTSDDIITANGTGGIFLDGRNTFDVTINSIKIIECSCTDEFLPQSFKDTVAINTATPGRNLTANNPTNITHNYDAYEQEVISATTAPTDAPDMEGQTWINTTNNTKYIAKDTKAVSDWLPIN